MSEKRGKRRAERKAKFIARLQRKAAARHKQRAVDYTKVTGQPLLQFDLAPLRELPAAAFTNPAGKDPLAAVVLALALAFNDLKDLEMFRWALFEKPRPDDAQPSAYSGQWSGMVTHVHRYVAAVLHELLYLLNKNRDTIESPAFQELVARLTPDSRKCWQELEDAAGGRSAAAKLLVRIRNSNAFHYYQPTALLDGFRRAFFSDSADPRLAAPMYSRGMNQEQTRFYFADAAVEHELTTACEAAGTDFNEILSTFGRSASFALYELVNAYIDRPTKTAAGEEQHQDV